MTSVWARLRDASPSSDRVARRLLARASARARAVRRRIRSRLSIPSLKQLPWGGWWLGWGDTIDQRLGTDYEAPEQRLLQRLLRSGMTFLDIGAHHGLYTLLASREVGSDGRVIAFEPSPRELRRLRWNLALNRCSNVSVEPVALGAAEGMTELFVCLSKETGFNSLRPPAGSGPIAPVQVLRVSLDQYLNGKKAGIKRVDVAKLDVEGGELEVLKGATRTLDTASPIILCELADVRTVQWGYRSDEIYKFLESRGYRWFCITADARLQPAPTKDKYHENLLAVPLGKLHLIRDSMERAECA